jgi:deazaflavin-dependent oxidoreductase (nitroreductase family)
MSFDSTKGTRGGRQPSGPLFRWINTWAARRLRRKGGKMMGFNALVLTTVGRKSGLERNNPVGWFPGPDGSWLIVASANGAVNNPAWYYNIAAHPDQVIIEIDGRKIPVVAQQLHGPEREEAWRRVTTAAPRFAKYEHKTDRALPVLRLTAASRTTKGA